MKILLSLRPLASVVAVTLLLFGLFGYMLSNPTYADVSARPERVDTTRGSVLTTLESLSTTTTTPPFVSIPDIRDLLADISNLFSGFGTTSATSTASATSTTSDVFGIALGIPDIISDVLSGKLPTSSIGPFVKCELLAGMGWPIPTFSSECPLGSNPPNQPPPGRALLTIVKNSVGGNSTFDFSISGSNIGTTSVATSGGTGSVNIILNPGTTTVSENAVSGWILSSLGCTANATSTGSASGSSGWQVVLGVGSHAICTFTNTRATSTATSTGTLVVIKNVVNNDGGAATSSNFTIHVNATSSSDSFPGSASGTRTTLLPRTYTVSETGGPSGYTTVFSGDCNASGSVIVSSGSTSTCTITNHDNPGMLTLIKNTIGGNGSFNLSLTGSTTETTTITTTNGTGTVQLPLNFGTTTLSEAGLGGWAFTSGICMLNSTTTGTSVQSGVQFFNGVFGSNFTCTITNTATSTPQITDGVGGGSGEEILTSNSGGGGANNPTFGVGGGGGPPSGQVLGATTAVPEVFGVGGGGEEPGMPDTGQGGSAFATLSTLVASFVGMVGGLALLARRVIR